jgi:hypothetical protein
MNYDDSFPWPSNMTSNLRLLPWRDPSGKRCYLSSAGGAHSTMSRLADEAEATQTSTAERIVAGAREVLDDPHADARSLRFALRHACEALDDLLLIAESRGARLLPADMEEEQSPDEQALPILPAESF